MWTELSEAGSTASKTPGCLHWAVRGEGGWSGACGLTLMGAREGSPPTPGGGRGPAHPRWSQAPASAPAPTGPADSQLTLHATAFPLL